MEQENPNVLLSCTALGQTKGKNTLFRKVNFSLSPGETLFLQGSAPQQNSLYRILLRRERPKYGDVYLLSCRMASGNGAYKMEISRLKEECAGLVRNLESEKKERLGETRDAEILLLAYTEEIRSLEEEYREKIEKEKEKIRESNRVNYTYSQEYFRKETEKIREKYRILQEKETEEARILGLQFREEQEIKEEKHRTLLSEMAGVGGDEFSPMETVFDAYRGKIEEKSQKSLEEIQEEVRKILAFVGIPPEKADMSPYVFPEKDRVWLDLGRAIAVNPKVIIVLGADSIGDKAKAGKLLRAWQEATGGGLLLLGESPEGFDKLRTETIAL